MKTPLPSRSSRNIDRGGIWVVRKSLWSASLTESLCIGSLFKVDAKNRNKLCQVGSQENFPRSSSLLCNGIHNIFNLTDVHGIHNIFNLTDVVQKNYQC
mmetsp:Transcript_5188/g.16580  ORF Transcript_5188/g.16580 Transcript_5188/m.16580 type:complete len:99 (+) Transcript_5188:781-1077(+)